jgi:hypothetical protein
VRSREWLDFVEGACYRTVALWMSDAWTTVQAEGWQAPMHWHKQDDGRQILGTGA